MEGLDFSKLFKKAWIILIAAVLSAVAVFVYAKEQPVNYQVYARLLVGSGIDSLRPDLNSLRASGQIIQTYAELPLTEPFLQEVIDDLGLEMQPSRLAKMISVRPNPETQILSIEVRSPDEGLAQAVAYRMAEKLVELSPSNPNSPVAHTRQQLQMQAVELEKAVEETRRSLQGMEADYQKILANDRLGEQSTGPSQALMAQLDQFETNSQLFASAAAQRETGIRILEEMVINANSRIYQYQLDLKQSSNPVITRLVSDQIRLEQAHVSNLRQVIAEVSRPVEGMPLDQYLQTTEQQVLVLDKSINETPNLDLRKLQFDQWTQLRNRLSQARATESSRQEKILQQIAGERARLSDSEFLQVEIQRQLTTQINQERNRLADLQNTLALVSTNVQEAEPNQVKIIEQARPVPITPPLSLMLLVGAMAGAVLAAVGILAASYLSQTVDTSDQLARLLAAPTFDLDPSHSRIYHLFRRQQTRSERLETFQRIALRLLYDNSNADRKVVLVSPTDSHNDAGLVAANLALVLSQSGKRVILIDANPDNPTIARHFKLGKREGITDFLAGTFKKSLPVASIDPYPSLGVLPYGSAQPNTVLKNTSLMITQLERLKERVDIVLVSAPAIQRPYTLALASNASGVILVTAKGKTSQPAIETVLENLNLVGAKVLAGVLKNTHKSAETLEWPKTHAQFPADVAITEILAGRPNTAPDNNENNEPYGTQVAS